MREFSAEDFDDLPVESEEVKPVETITETYRIDEISEDLAIAYLEPAELLAYYRKKGIIGGAGK